MAATPETVEQIRTLANDKYKYGFVTDIESDVAPKGLDEDTVCFISAKKEEPEWMLEWRLKAYRAWLEMEAPDWAKLKIEPIDYQEADLVRVDILLNSEQVDAFATIVHRDSAYEYGRRMAEKLKEIIPRQQFEIPIQAAIGGRIIARETVRAFRKDVTEKLYGGDVTRKNKLLKKQKEGKRKMKNIGRVEIPPDTFIRALRLDA